MARTQLRTVAVVVVVVVVVVVAAATPSLFLDRLWGYGSGYGSGVWLAHVEHPTLLKT